MFSFADTNIEKQANIVTIEGSSKFVGECFRCSLCSCLCRNTQFGETEKTNCTFDLVIPIKAVKAEKNNAPTIPFVNLLLGFLRFPYSFTEIRIYVMGNASGGYDGEGPSGTKKFEGKYGGVYLESSSSDHGVLSEPMEAHSSPSSPNSCQSHLLFSHPHDHMIPLQKPERLIHSLQQSMSNHIALNINSSRIKLSWNNGGRQVAVTGSWDNWETRELLQGTCNDGFYMVKTLPPGEYQYLFIVDGCLRCAPDLPWICDGSGNAYNVLDLQGCDSELPESLSEFESPSSPPSSYDNKYLDEDDFSKPPPETPPQLQGSILNEPSYSNDAQPQPLAQPQRSELNHLYIQNPIEGQFVALGSTRRFHQKYVTMLLHRPSRRTN